jgi:hypothetical protein
MGPVVTGSAFNSARVTTALNEHCMNKHTTKILHEIKAREPAPGEDADVAAKIMGGFSDLPDDTRKKAEEYIALYRSGLEARCKSNANELAERKAELGRINEGLEAYGKTPRDDDNEDVARERREFLVRHPRVMERIDTLTKYAEARQEELAKFLAQSEFEQARLAAESYQFRFRKSAYTAMTSICEELIHDLCLHAIRNTLNHERNTFTDELIIKDIHKSKFYTLFRNFSSWTEFCSEVQAEADAVAERKSWSEERRKEYNAKKKVVSEERKAERERIKQANKLIDQSNQKIMEHNTPLLPRLKLKDVNGDREELTRRNKEIDEKNEKISSNNTPLRVRQKMEVEPKPIWEDLFKGYIKSIARLHIRHEMKNPDDKKSTGVCRISESFTKIVSHLVFDLIVRFGDILTTLLRDVKDKQKTVDMCHVLGVLKILMLDADQNVHDELAKKVTFVCTRINRYNTLKAKRHRSVEEQHEFVGLTIPMDIDYEQPEKPVKSNQRSSEK